MSATQSAKLTDLITAALNARGDAEAGTLFASHAGRALVNAMFELTEVDGLYTLCLDVEHDAAVSERKAA